MRSGGRLAASAAIVAILLGAVPAAAWDSLVPSLCEADEQWNARWAAEHNLIYHRTLRALGAEVYAREGGGLRPGRPGEEDCNASLYVPTECLQRERYSQADAPSYVTDLGAWMDDPLSRRNAPGARERCGDVRTTELEERHVPDPHHFAELPDAVYTVYDWIGKATVCLPRPSVVDQFAGLSLESLDGSAGCHRFVGWMGNMNSNHFGSQAVRHYQAYHRIALWLAEQAGQLRQRIEQAAPGKRGYDEYIDEAEREALIFEGVAQHFLTDRWSMGHMWERWGGPDERLGVPFETGLLVASISGLVHGAEGVLNFPTPLCSPLINDLPLPPHWLAGEASGKLRCPAPAVILSEIKVPQYRREGQSPGQAYMNYAVGDHRFEQLLEGSWNPADYRPGDAKFDACFANAHRFDLTTAVQLASMDRCTRASAGRVIQAFGANGSGFGLHSIPLPELPEADLDSRRSSCFGNFATNESMWMSIYSLLGLEATRRLAHLVAELIVPDLKTPTGKKPLPIDLEDFARMVYKKQFELYDRFVAAITAFATDVHLAKAYHPQLDDMAANPPDLMGVPGGAWVDDTYGLAEYVETAVRPNSDQLRYGSQTVVLPDLDQLPHVAKDVPTRDRRTLYGFFNRAHAEYWCERTSPDRSTGGRPFDEENTVYLDSVRGSKDPADLEVCALLVDRMYRGTVDAQPEGEGFFEERSEEDPHPICDIHAGIWAQGPQGWPEPQELPVGYSAAPGARMSEAPWFDRYLRSVVNWCRRIPVLVVIKKDGLYNAGEARLGEDLILLGEHFGDTPGKLRLIGADGIGRQIRTPYWTSEEILANRTDLSVGTFRVEITRPASAEFLEDRITEPIAYVKILPNDAQSDGHSDGQTDGTIPCDLNCGDGQSCCPTMWGPTCVDLKYDKYNCGRCGNDCPVLYSVANEFFPESRAPVGVAECCNSTCVQPLTRSGDEFRFTECCADRTSLCERTYKSWRTWGDWFNGYYDWPLRFEQVCEGVKVDLASDPAHCGLKYGPCGAPCGQDETCCHGLCTRLGDSFLSCGACGRSCLSTSQTCVQGECTPKTGPATSCSRSIDNVCSGWCIDEHAFEACGDSCQQCQFDQKCCPSGCLNVMFDSGHANRDCTACASGTTACFGVCVDLQGNWAPYEKNPWHICGDCNVHCRYNQQCCDGGCVSLQTDPLHCGSCGHVCAQHESCCPGELEPGICVDLTNDPANCGRCGKTCASGVCESSTCQ